MPDNLQKYSTNTTESLKRVCCHF